MNPLARLSNFNATLSAALHDWKQQQGSALAWPKADQIAVQIVEVVALAFVIARFLPETEQTIWLRVNLFFWVHTAIGACIVVLTFVALSRAIGAGIVEAWYAGKERHAELQQEIAAGETRQAIEPGEPEDWTFPNGMSPYLTNSDRLRISQATNPKLNDTTGALVKAGIAHGMTAAQVAAETGLSDTLVRRYAAIFRRGENLSQPIPLSVESE